MQKLFNTIKIIWNRFIHLISDLYYYKKGDRSSMYKHKQDLGITPSWRDYCRNPVVGIFGKFLL